MRQFFICALCLLLVCCSPTKTKTADANASDAVRISGYSAHWLNLTTLVWSQSDAASRVELRWSPYGNFQLSAPAAPGGDAIACTPGVVDKASAAKFLHLKDWPAWQCDASPALAQAALRAQLIALAYDDKNQLLAATKVQTPGVIDDLFTTDRRLGAFIDKQGTHFALWAPTARSVKLMVFHADKRLAENYPVTMKYVPLVSKGEGNEADAGTWHYTVPGDLSGMYYQYHVEVFHYQTGRVEQLVVSDPYSLSLSRDGVYSQIISLDSANTQPPGWRTHSVPTLENPEAMVVYEAHVRDFSAWDSKVPTEHRGKYGAFTKKDSAGRQHLNTLIKSGVNTIQLLPVFDFGSVIEDARQRIELGDTLETLCKRKPSSAICATHDRQATLLSLMQQFDPATEDAQALMSLIREIDGFNWGYDPVHYTVPEGSYASNPDGVTRIVELRTLIKTLHELGLRVVMDVVYNHTYQAGLDKTSVLDKIVPGYYYRRDEHSGDVATSTCCFNTASEHNMMEKLMIDSLKVWARDYKMDGFRFDLMGHHMRPNMEKALAAVKEIDADTFIYGEGWDFGEVAGGRRGPNAIQHTMSGAGIGSFNNRLRASIRGGSSFEQGDDIRRTQGMGTGLFNFPNELNSASEAEKNTLLHYADMVRLALAGNLQAYPLLTRHDTLLTGIEIDYDGQQTTGYAADPQENVNYISVHDGQTLWDGLQYKGASHHSPRERVRMHNYALSFPVLAQGIAFVHMGAELLRSKSMQHDSYDSGDWYNKVDFTGQDNNWNVGLPRKDKDGANYDVIQRVIADKNAVVGPAEIAFATAVFKEWVTIRQSSPLFGLPEADQIIDMLSFHNTGSEQIPGLIVMKLTDTQDLDKNAQAIMVVFNGTNKHQRINSQGLSYALHPAQRASADDVVRQSKALGQELVVPALTTAVFVAAE